MEVFSTIKITENKKSVVESLVVEEFSLTIVLGGERFVTLLCSPSDLKSLVMGFLFTSGVIKKSSDIKDITIDLDKGVAMAEQGFVPLELKMPGIFTSSGGKEVLNFDKTGKIYSKFTIKSSNIYSLMEDFLNKSQIFSKTGGVHSAALSDGEKIVIFKEDIGRHNAVDKVIGEALFEDISLADKALITTGRVSSEIVVKIQRCGIPVIISKSAPTNQAVRFSEDTGITLIGFARKSSLNIYTREDRVAIE
ncbi:MAG: formate dehydrogenase accessory sulfurtransferase FdhD [Candidatus Omnitrophota bacterium]